MIYFILAEKVKPLEPDEKQRFQFPGRRQAYFHYGYYISLHRHPK